MNGVLLLLVLTQICPELSQPLWMGVAGSRRAMEVGLVTQILSVRTFWGLWEHEPSVAPSAPSFPWPPSRSWRL